MDQLESGERADLARDLEVERFGGGQDLYRLREASGASITVGRDEIAELARYAGLEVED